MNTSAIISLNKSIALAVLFAGGASIATAAPATTGSNDAGLLGERYFGATADFVVFDDNDLDDGLGLTLVYNHPLREEIDLSVSYSYLGSDVEGTDITSQDLMVGATFHSAMGNGRGFLRAEAGVIRLKAGRSETEIGFAVTAGYEIPVGGQFALTPFISWSDLVDSDLDVDGSLDVGLMAEWRASDTISLVGQIARDDDSNLGLSFGAAFRF